MSWRPGPSPFLSVVDRPFSRTGDAIERMLHDAHELAQRIRLMRFEAGALALDFPETKIRLDDRGRILRLEKVENDISHQLIEEYMLLANEAVAGMVGPAPGSLLSITSTACAPPSAFETPTVKLELPTNGGSTATGCGILPPEPCVPEDLAALRTEEDPDAND